MPPKEATPKSAAPKEAPKAALKASKAAQKKAGEPPDDEPRAKQAKKESNQVATAPDPAPSIAVAAYNFADDTSIEVHVKPSDIDGQYHVRGLRDAIKGKIPEKCIGIAVSDIKIYHRIAEDEMGDAVPDGPLPGASGNIVQSYFFRLPSSVLIGDNDSQSAMPADTSFFSEEGTPRGRHSEQLANELDTVLMKAAAGQTATTAVFPTTLINGDEIDRGTKLALLQHIVSLAAAVKRGSQDKVDFPLACTVCGSGGGKTTLLWLMSSAWKDDLVGALGVSSLRIAFATFNNNCIFTAAEGDVFQKPSSRLGVRLLASFRGCTMEYIKQTLVSGCNKRYGQLNITRFLHKLRPADDSATLILIDELLSLHATNEEVKDLLYELAGFQQNELVAGRKVIAVVTSLSSTQLSFLPQKTQRRLAPISLPMISPAKVLEEARRFVNSLKQLRPDEGFSENVVHHLICEFCATGGHLKSMSDVTLYFTNPAMPLTNSFTNVVDADYFWASTILRWSLFSRQIPSERKVSDTPLLEGERLTKLQHVIDSHLVTVADSKTDTDGVLVLQVRIRVHHLRSIPQNDSDLSVNQRTSLRGVMDALTWPQADGAYSKRFEEALMHAICLRLSMLADTGASLWELLPNGQGPAINVLSSATIARVDRCMRTVQKLENSTFSQLQHGDVVLSELSNEGAVEGFIALRLRDKMRVIFVQMKFWKACSSGEIKQWEEKINKRATDEFGLQQGAFFAAFFSTSVKFDVTAQNSCAWALGAVEDLLAPFGVAPMMLYAKERGEKPQ